MRQFNLVHGAGLDSDLFLWIYNIPDIIFKLLNDGLFLALLVPQFTLLLQAREKRRANDLASAWMVFGGFGGLLAMALLHLFRGPVLHLLLPGYSAEILVRLGHFFSNSLPYLPCIFPYGIAMAWLHSHDRFFAPALSTVFFNVVLLASIESRQPIGALATAIALGGAVQLLSQYPSLRASGFTLSLDFFAHWGKIRSTLRTLGPLFFILLARQGLGLLERSLLSLFQPGSLTYFTLANKVIELPVNLITLTLITVMFPKICRHVQEGEGRWRLSHQQTLIALLALLLPITFALYLLSGTALQILFALNHPTAQKMTAELLQGYCLSVIPVSLLLLAQRTLFALGENRLAIQSFWGSLALHLGIVVAGVKWLGLGVFPLALTASHSVVAIGATLAIARKGNQPPQLG